MHREITVLPLSAIDQVLKIHIMALPDDVLPNLGPEALLNYYKRVFADESQILLGAIENDQIVGFCQISMQQVNLLTNVWSFRTLLGLVNLAIRHPQIFYSGVKQFIKSTAVDESTAEISFIAVKPEYQGNGLGRALLDYANQLCVNKKLFSMQTKTANQQLKKFYIREFQAKELYSFDVGRKKYSLLKWSTGQTNVRNHA